MVANPTDTKEYRAPKKCKHSFCNAHLFRELMGAHETTKRAR
jgi:hypothetical protein